MLRGNAKRTHKKHKIQGLAHFHQTHQPMGLENAQPLLYTGIVELGVGTCQVAGLMQPRHRFHGPQKYKVIFVCCFPDFSVTKLFPYFGLLLFFYGISDGHNSLLIFHIFLPILFISDSFH